MAEPLRTYIYFIAVLVLSSTAAVVNFATVCAILFNRVLRKRQNVFTFNLALADCISAVALFFSNFYDYPEIPSQWRTESFPWEEPLFTAGLLISILSTLAIAFERLIIFRFDVLGSRQIVTAKRSIAICVIGWAIVPSTYLCINTFDESVSNTLGYVVSPCVILACLAITAFCYIVIYKKIATISDNIGLNDAALQRRAKNSKKILVTFALIVASTCACWVIMCIVLLVETYGRIEEIVWFLILSDVGFALVSVNGILNPVIIWLRLTIFRDQLNACFGRRLCHRVFESQNPSLSHSDAPTSTNKQSISTINISMQDCQDITND